MAHASGSRRAPHSGRLRGRPLAYLLAHANERGVSGTISLAERGKRATISLRAGRVLSVRSSEGGPYLGTILEELGAIDAPTLERTLGEMRHGKRLHGEVLLEAGAITREQLDAALIEQVRQKLIPLFALSDDATFTTREDAALVSEARDADRPTLDPFPLIWSGVRAKRPNEHVQRAVARIEGAVAVVFGPELERMELDADELAFCEQLRASPASTSRAVASSPLGETRTEMLLYCLALSGALALQPTRVLGPRELGRAGVRGYARAICAEEDPFDVLGLHRGASIEAARAAFFRLARAWDPNRLPHDLVDLRHECTLIFRAINDAHRTIVEQNARHLSLVPPPDRGGGGRHGTPRPAEHRLATSDEIGALRREASTPANSIEPTPRDSMELVDAALAEGDLLRASSIARRLAYAGQDGPRARAVVVWCSAGGDDARSDAIDGAIRALDRVLAGDPDCDRALYYRGRLHACAGRAEAAFRDLRKALRLNPNDAEINRGIELVLSGAAAGNEGPRTRNPSSGERRVSPR